LRVQLSRPGEREVEGFVDGLLFDVRQQVNAPGRSIVHARRRQLADVFVIVLATQPKLLEIVDALRAAGRLAGGLHRRQQQRDQDADDGDHNQQFHQRKARARATATRGLSEHFRFPLDGHVPLGPNNASEACPLHRDSSTA
jgi:hypothetical protein